MKTHLLPLLACAMLGSFTLPSPAAPSENFPELSSYNVRWDSPSTDSMDSMPLSGRHGAGANVWVQDGSIWLYLGHSSAFDENSALLKLGGLRITPEAGLLADPASFQQELDLPSRNHPDFRQIQSRRSFHRPTLVCQRNVDRRNKQRKTGLARHRLRHMAGRHPEESQFPRRCQSGRCRDGGFRPDVLPLECQIPVVAGRRAEKTTLCRRDDPQSR